MFCVSLGNQRLYFSASQFASNFFFGVVAAVGENFVRTFAASAVGRLDWFNRVDDFNGHFRIMDVGGSMFNGQWNTLAIGNQVPLRTSFPSIRGIRAGFCPPKTARTLQLSSADVDQSITSASPSSSSSTRQTFFQTPASCQSRNRRQHVIPEPHPISCGRYSHGVPVLRIKRIPVNAARSDIRGRPPLGLGGSGGNNGSIRLQSASGNSGLAISSSLTLAN